MSDHQQLNRDGYAVIRQALDVHKCEAALAAIAGMKQRHQTLVSKNADDYGYLYRVVNLHLAVPELRDAFAGIGKALAVSDEFFGEPTSLYTSLYYERGSEQALHRDTPYFTTKPAGRYLGVWLALDDVDDGNGPLRVVPESHKLPPVDVRALRKEVFGGETIPSISMEGWDRYQAEVKKQCDERGMVSQDVHVNRGDVIIWHPEMFHGGAPHLDKARSRRSLVMHVTPVGVPVYHIDVFYDPDRKVDTKAGWRYDSYNGRQIARFDQIDFGHEYTVKPSELR